MLALSSLRENIMRAVWVLLHRYIGLATAIFLLMAGLTGSVLAFNHELDEWLNPTFYEASSEGVQLPPGTLVDRLQGQHPKLQVWYMEYPNEGGHTALLAAVPRNNPITGKPFEEPNQVFYLDPVSGEQTGHRRPGYLGRAFLSPAITDTWRTDYRPYRTGDHRVVGPDDCGAVSHRDLHLVAQAAGPAQ